MRIAEKWFDLTNDILRWLLKPTKYIFLTYIKYTFVLFGIMCMPIAIAITIVNLIKMIGGIL